MSIPDGANSCLVFCQYALGMDQALGRLYLLEVPLWKSFVYGSPSGYTNLTCSRRPNCPWSWVPDRRLVIWTVRL